MLCVYAIVFLFNVYGVHAVFRERLKELPKWLEGHAFSISSDAPLSTNFAKHQEGKPALQHLIQHFDTQAKRVHAYATSDVSQLQFSTDRTCNIPKNQASWKAVQSSSSNNGFGILKSECVTQLASPVNDSLTLNMHTYFNTVEKVGNITVAQTVNNWTRVYINNEFTYNESPHICFMSHAVGYRIDGTWVVGAGLTNAPITEDKADWERHYLVEYLYINPQTNLVDSYRFSMPNESYVMINDTTTIFSSWGGKPDASYFGNMGMEQCPAVRAALVLGEKLREQAQDSTTPSNIAILVLPLLMAAVPIALFADVSACVTVGYTIVTDIMSGMPLAIKGIELIEFARKELEATRSRVYGGETLTELTVVETWISKCTTETSLMSTGIIFLTIAIVVMIIGVILEILARWIVKRRKMASYLRKKDEDYRLEHIWSRQPLCDRCPCDARERELADAVFTTNSNPMPYDAAPTPFDITPAPTPFELIDENGMRRRG